MAKAIFNKESLETLRRRIDLVDLLSAHLDLKRTGAAYKALCPFHDEKTPSFVVQKGESHYHCFGCGAHGDAIQFLMTHQKLSFLDAVESLAQRFQVNLERVESSEPKGPNKALLKEALNQACRFFHFILLHTPEGHEVLKYLYKRGLDLDFIRHFEVGLAPAVPGLLRNALHAKGIKDEIMVDAGLLTTRAEGGYRDFFADRITFPIRDAAGAVIGFSARKYKEETFGGKYINTTETALFKKSRVLFGLNYCRRRIAKEQKAIIVEGQIDALRLIYAGFNITVAGQGTAFGEGHVREIVALGVTQVYLALDGDAAGQEATSKIGHLFLKEGIDVRIVQLPQGSDPDSFLKQYGPQQFLELMNQSIDYIAFIVRYHARHVNMESAAGKHQLVKDIATQIRSWNHPVLVHEGLRKLAHLTQIPEDMVGVGQEFMPNIYVQKSASIGLQTINPDRILESDLLRWLLLMRLEAPEFIETARRNVLPEDLKDLGCQQLYTIILNHAERGELIDLLSLASEIDEEGQGLIAEILGKKVNKERAEVHLGESIQRILDRNWMLQSEEVKRKIQSGACSDDEVGELIKAFDALKRNQPKFKKA